MTPTFFTDLNARMDKQQLYGADRYVVMAKELLKEQAELRLDAAIRSLAVCSYPTPCGCDDCIDHKDHMMSVLNRMDQ